MATRWETIKDLQKQVNRLKDKSVEDLMHAGGIEELKIIEDEIDLSTIIEFFEERDDLMLGIQEIPDGCFLSTVFFLRFFTEENEVKVNDNQLFDDWEKIAEQLILSEDALKNKIGEKMEEMNLYDMDLEDLLGLDNKGGKTEE